MQRIAATDPAESSACFRRNPHDRHRLHAPAASLPMNDAAFACRRAALGFVAVATVRENLSFKPPIRHALVNSVCVARSARGGGVGRALMACAEAWAREQGAVDLRLSVFEFNRRAMRLYEELGYVARSIAMGKPLLPLRQPPEPEPELQAQGADS